MQTYIFDFDGTLANSGKTGILATQAAFKAFSFPIPEEKVINYYMGIPIEISFKKMFPNHQFSTQEFDDLLTCFRTFYRKYESDYLTLFNDIMPVLQSLDQQGKLLYIVSSKHSTALLRNLKHLNIAQFFDRVIGSDHVQKSKPAPDGILTILNQQHLNPSECIMIGDAIFDIQMGQAAGVHTCGVLWGAHDKKSLSNERPDFLLTTPQELLSI
ncbi:HAD family hydrolase [Leuconostoc rapi]|uniref:HAD family hydrolase n=1 Tax=Leuconostoc rapi TaxID=1406906 RepID=UPI00195B6E42|nr:HAD-IA family hydrolase [Leuconostoc rapi]MBM7436588.1 HAD superfamily hydrolase (TIGR01509 family) [Leuconostoc rapi]